MIPREQIIQKLTETLEPQSFIYALWLEGADALNTLDAYSDIDLWLDVEAAKLQEGFTLIQKALLSLGSLELEFDVNHPDKYIEQRFFRLKNSSKFLLIDVCIQSHERTVLLNPELDAVIVLFDKAEVIRFSESLSTDVFTRVKGIQDAYLLYSVQLEKYLARAEYLTAVSAYQTRIFMLLVELLRLKHCPIKADYGVKHIYTDLPLVICERLETLQSFNGLSSLATQYTNTKDWINTLISDLSS